jgi:hypothetical protein
MIGRAAALAGGWGGAGDRDRTGMASLEGWGSTIELRPHAPRRRSGPSVPGAGFFGDASGGRRGIRVVA